MIYFCNKFDSDLQHNLGKSCIRHEHEYFYGPLETGAYCLILVLFFSLFVHLSVQNLTRKHFIVSSKLSHRHISAGTKVKVNYQSRPYQLLRFFLAEVCVSFDFCVCVCVCVWGGGGGLLFH